MNSTKTFDAVKMMRAIRDDLSNRIKSMSLEEELEWLAKQKLDDPLLRRLREKDDAGGGDDLVGGVASEIEVVEASTISKVRGQV
jgi:hypothetical protein